MDAFEKALLTQCEKVKSEVLEKALDDEQYGYSLLNRKPRSIYGPLSSEEATKEISELAMDTFYDKKSNDNDMKKWSWVEEDNLLSYRYIPTMIVESLENVLECTNQEAIDYFEKGPFGSKRRIV